MFSPVADPTPQAPGWTPKSIKKSTENKVQHKTAKSHQNGAPETQKCEKLRTWPLNSSKMEPKMEPKVIQKVSMHKSMKNSIFACIYHT